MFVKCYYFRDNMTQRGFAYSGLMQAFVQQVFHDNFVFTADSTKQLYFYEFKEQNVE